MKFPRRRKKEPPIKCDGCDREIKGKPSIIAGKSYCPKCVSRASFAVVETRKEVKSEQ